MENSVASNASSAEQSSGNNFLDQISATHAPSASNLDPESLLNIVTNVLNRASPNLDDPSPVIENLSCEIKQKEVILLCGGTNTDTEWTKVLEFRVKTFYFNLGVTKTDIEVVRIHGNNTEDSGLLERFWNRMESLLFYKTDNDRRDIQKLFGYKKAGKWAMVLWKGEVQTIGDGDYVLGVFSSSETEFE